MHWPHSRKENVTELHSETNLVLKGGLYPKLPGPLLPFHLSAPLFSVVLFLLLLVCWLIGWFDLILYVMFCLFSLPESSFYKVANQIWNFKRKECLFSENPSKIQSQYSLTNLGDMGIPHPNMGYTKLWQVKSRSCVHPVMEVKEEVLFPFEHGIGSW